MNQKTIPAAPGRIITASANPGAGPREHAAHSRTFAEILAEAEAVEDHVQLHTMAGSETEIGLDAAVQGVAGILLGPPVPGAALRAAKPRRAAGKGQ